MHGPSARSLYEVKERVKNEFGGKWNPHHPAWIVRAGSEAEVEKIRESLQIGIDSIIEEYRAKKRAKDAKVIDAKRSEAAKKAHARRREALLLKNAEEIDDELVCLILRFIHPVELRTAACASRRILECAKTTIRMRAFKRIASPERDNAAIGFHDGYGYDLTENVRNWRSFRAPISIWMRKECHAAIRCTIKYEVSEINADITNENGHYRVHWVKNGGAWAAIHANGHVCEILQPGSLIIRSDPCLTTMRLPNHRRVECPMITERDGSVAEIVRLQAIVFGACIESGLLVPL